MSTRNPTLQRRRTPWIAGLATVLLCLAGSSAIAGDSDAYRNYLRDQLERDRFQVKALRTQIDVLRVRLESSRKAGDSFSTTDSRKELRRIYRQEAKLTDRIEAAQTLLTEYAAAPVRAGARSDVENRAGLATIITEARRERASLEPRLKRGEIREAEFHKRHAVLVQKIRLASEALNTCKGACKAAVPKAAAVSQNDDLERVEAETLGQARIRFAQEESPQEIALSADEDDASAEEAAEAKAAPAKR